MKSVFEYFSNSGYTFEECNFRQDFIRCHTCNESIEGSVGYWFTDTRLSDRQSIFLHKTCSELPISVYLHEHSLCLKEDNIFSEDAACRICNKPIAGSPTFTCTNPDENVNCQNFYLHKICAELPLQINHHKHNIHPLALFPQPDGHICSVCTRSVKICYACYDCEFNVCVFCAFEQRVLHHEGHKEHTLTLMKKESLFQCDACNEEAKDYFYACTTCDFVVHKSICGEFVCKSYWVYYCHKCTYFVHMKCSTSTVSMRNKDEADDIDNESDLLQFPLPSQESMFDLIVTQCAKSQIDLKDEGENCVTMSTAPNDPHIIEKHWSHEIHPLQQLLCTVSENDEDDNDGRRTLICNGCIQPITVSHPSYYACIQCGFFLHSFCATKLPQKLPVGASHFHPNHSLLLQKPGKFYYDVLCESCYLVTNGFYYHCQTCDINIDIRCAFLPTRIKHKSHKHHSLVQRFSSNSRCCVSGSTIENDMVYACETCSNFQMKKYCIFFPSSAKHKYETHPLTLRYPPFFYEGVFYCEICEERVNNQELLYHCSESEHSFHRYCLGVISNMKLGGSIKVFIMDKPHTLALVIKNLTRNKSTDTCSQCLTHFSLPECFLECDGCGILACAGCASKLLGEKQANNRAPFYRSTHSIYI
ncbi:uncharacterized protein LOC108195353 isoform X2 [Daucus carota subsp. sativus]|uniref:uncharacterized protein LOC108195353 isoform X2 n=1 Tax=Daucus carota subsp. sativus TaxID=79200 RepID=UPI0007F03ED6|nr:PREDICTED: uncharacterized protein LOC108195353 isoform X2 [Daucus carota subsp. sativus]